MVGLRFTGLRWSCTIRSIKTTRKPSVIGRHGSIRRWAHHAGRIPRLVRASWDDAGADVSEVRTILEGGRILHSKPESLLLTCSVLRQCPARPLPPYILLPYPRHQDRLQWSLDTIIQVRPRRTLRRLHPLRNPPRQPCHPNRLCQWRQPAYLRKYCLLSSL